MKRKRKTKQYDVVVIGSGSGASIVDRALYQDMKVALVDKGPLGGTCLNVGCIPSKILIFPADRIVEIEEAHKLGVTAEITDVDFPAIMARMRRMISNSQRSIRQGISGARNLDFYETTGHFVGERTLEVDGQRIEGERVFIASGSRPHIPAIEGLAEVPYLTNETVLDLDECPESIAIIGGGYVGAEYAHFFAAMGAEVTLVQRNEHLVPEEEPEISELLARKLGERTSVHTHCEAVAVALQPEGVEVTCQDVGTGERRTFTAEKVMLATGRRSNADLLQVENGGIETDAQGYVKTNEYLETNVENVWAFGDANGKHMFTHMANREAAILWHNIAHEHKVPIDYSAVPHAVFSHPQIGSVGMTEAQAKAEREVLIGEAKYLDTAKGQAMMETDGFAKAILEKKSGKILGFHIIGPYAPMLIQEVVDAMGNDGPARWITAGMHIHPALPELIVSALYNLREPH
jgi:dihydrolipoamide dehydrogenase